MVLQSYPKNLARIRYFLFVKKEGVESFGQNLVLFFVKKEGLNKVHEAIGTW